jgi:hypothetical protein
MASFWSKLLLVLLYFYISVYIFIISSISFIVKGPANGPFGSNRGSRGSISNRNPLLLALCSPVPVGAITGSKGI